MANEKKVVLSSVKIEKSNNNVPYLRLEYSNVAVASTDPALAAFAADLGLIHAEVDKPIVDVMSSSKFITDASGKQTPDIAAATEWCNKMGPAFGRLKAANFQFTAREYVMPVSDYYRKNSDGSVDTSTVHNTMSVWCILDPMTNEPWTPNAPQSKANSRLKNGGSMYQLVSTYQKIQTQTAQAEDILATLTGGASEATTMEF